MVAVAAAPLAAAGDATRVALSARVAKDHLFPTGTRLGPDGRVAAFRELLAAEGHWVATANLCRTAEDELKKGESQPWGSSRLLTTLDL